MNISAEKKAAREGAMAKRKAAHKAAHGAGKGAAEHLLSWLKTQPDIRSVSGYMPIHSELDILPAMHALHALGYTLSVPVIMGKAMPLKFSKWTPDTEMVKGEFGALVPKTNLWQRPDLLLCPMLAFDTKGQRMGYGGGFYDRTIAQLAPVQTLGFAYAAQRVRALPSEPTDMPLDGIVTETGIFWP